MEYLSGKIKIKKIFLHNNHWFNFHNQHQHLIRAAIVENVTKVLSCQTPLLGFHHYHCGNCSTPKKVPHSCKSRFCTSCGKTQTDKWISNAINTLPDVHYQHITFTLPDQYWPLFRMNRSLIGELPRIAANIVLDICKYGKKRKHYLPGIFLAIHTYGRALNFNIHVHLSVTFGGFSISNPEKYVKGSTIDHKIIKDMWKYQITTLLRNYFKQTSLIPYPDVAHHFENLPVFNKWLDSHYQKTWNVYLQKTQKGAKITAQYLGKYLKKPPLAEARIDSYDGENVTFTYLDHYSHTNTQKTLTVSEFIKTLIIHIPDKYFRMIRYYGFLANRVRTRFLKLFKPDHQPGQLPTLSYLKRFYRAFGHNPLKCACGSYLKLVGISFSTSIHNLTIRHNLKAAYLASS